MTANSRSDLSVAPYTSVGASAVLVPLHEGRAELLSLAFSVLIHSKAVVANADHSIVIAIGRTFFFVGNASVVSLDEASFTNTCSVFWVAVVGAHNVGNASAVVVFDVSVDAHALVEGEHFVLFALRNIWWRNWLGWLVIDGHEVVSYTLTTDQFEPEPDSAGATISIPISIGEVSAALLGAGSHCDQSGGSHWWRWWLVWLDWCIGVGIGVSC